MNDFLLFAYDIYYPSGGLRDLQGTFTTLEEAINEADKLTLDRKYIYRKDDLYEVWNNIPLMCKQ